jgi:hypothetical protein
MAFPIIFSGPGIAVSDQAIQLPMSKSPALFSLLAISAVAALFFSLPSPSAQPETSSKPVSRTFSFTYYFIYPYAELDGKPFSGLQSHFSFRDLLAATPTTATR